MTYKLMDILNRLCEGMWIPSEDDSVILNIEDMGNDEFVLKLVKENRGLGWMGIEKIDNDTYSVYSVQGERGFGAAIYEIAMTYIYPSYLTPEVGDELPSEDAQNVWKKYYHERDDVEKVRIEIYGDGDVEEDIKPFVHKYRIYNKKYEDLINDL